MLNTPPNNEIVPIDLTDRTVTAWVFAPHGSSGDSSHPNGFQLFVKDENWNSKYGSWHNIQEGNWSKISLTVGNSKPTDGSIDLEFDPSRIIVIGVKFGTGEDSTATYDGPIFVDSIGW